MCYKVAVLVFMMTACLEVTSSSQRQPQHRLIAKQATLTSSQMSCIFTVLDNTLDSSDTACRDVAQKLAELYFSTDVVGDISSNVSSFPTFCRPSCGQVIIDAWDSCNAYKDVKDTANLLIEMCASDKGSTCYSNFDNLFNLLNNGISCYEDFETSGRCSCSTTLSDGVQNYGCCVNVPIDYEDFEDESESINDAANTIFAECRVLRPNRCTNSPLNSPESTGNNSAASEKVPLFLSFIIMVFNLLI